MSVPAAIGAIVVLLPIMKSGGRTSRQEGGLLLAGLAVCKALLRMVELRSALLTCRAPG